MASTGGLFVRGGLVVASVAALSLVLLARTPPAGKFADLVFPLRSGHYNIANVGTLPYRGARYGIDIVASDAHAIFGDAIYAPCDGVVIRVEDWLPDLAPPQVDRAHMAGNFVMLECGDAGDVHVLLAHMRSGSVRAHPGDYVTTDNQLGEVGNSGNSDEPHLHIHAQRPGKPWDVFSGDPLPIRIDGRYLVRNDRVTMWDEGPAIIDD
jgi:murein DD-endopeptidase MepM/ murein hydrolase activator NlpD